MRSYLLHAAVTPHQTTQPICLPDLDGFFSAASFHESSYNLAFMTPDFPAGESYLYEAIFSVLWWLTGRGASS